MVPSRRSGWRLGVNAEEGLEKTRRAAQSRVDALARQKGQQEGGVILRDVALRETQAAARLHLYNRRQRQRAVAHAINQLLQMSEEAKSMDTTDRWNEATHANRAV